MPFSAFNSLNNGSKIISQSRKSSILFIWSENKEEIEEEVSFDAKIDDFRLDSRVYLGAWDGDDSSLQLSELFRLNERKLRRNALGVFKDRTESYEPQDAVFIWERRKNLEGVLYHTRTSIIN